MSEQKKRVSLWKRESASGNIYLSGRDKESGDQYFVFKNEAGERTVRIKKDGEDNFDNNFNVALIERSNDYGTFHTGGDLLLSTNRFYESDEDPAEAIEGDIRYMTRKDGSLVLNKNGEKVEKPTHQLVIG